MITIVVGAIMHCYHHIVIIIPFIYLYQKKNQMKKKIYIHTYMNGMTLHPYSLHIGGDHNRACIYIYIIIA